MSSCTVVIPCLNEEVALPRVIKDFQKALPSADIRVYDNGSTDNSVDVARSLGAKVRSVPLKGKGYALIQAFADIDTDYILIVDGDDTYEAGAASKLLGLATDQQLDMVTGIRKAIAQKKAYRLGHVLGNKILTGLVRKFFPGLLPNDMLSGYRVFSKRYYKSFPFIIPGFEIETYLTVHALSLAMPTGELDTVYKERPEGSVSKLNTYSDGFRILIAILKLIVQERPFFAFGWVSLFIGLVGFILGACLIPKYLETGLVPRFPTAFLSASFILLASIIATSGVLLHYISAGRREQRRLKYMEIEMD